MAQDAELDAWCETYHVTFMKKGGSAVDMRVYITSYDITGGDKDFTTMVNAKGGHIKKFETMTNFEVTIEGYTTEAGNSKGFMDMMHGTTADAAQPLSYPVDFSRDLYMLAICHTTDTSRASADVIGTAEKREERDSFKNGHITSFTQSNTDGIRKFTLKFKAAPFTKAAAANVTFESCDGSAAVVLPALTYA